jgi:ribosome biogenesis GTPase
MTPDGPLAAVVSGRLQHASSAVDLPAVGDWVCTTPPTDPGPVSIVHRFERTTVLTRRASGRRTEPQVLAANVDRVFVVCGLDGDFNVRRLERYLAVIAESGATPAVVLSKVDQCDAPQAQIAEAAEVSGGADLLLTCAPRGQGLEELAELLDPGQTAAFVGSSGAGKSTLINALLGSDVQRTSAVSERDGRGQHATTHRELFVLPGGALLVDTPGLRELGIWSEQDAPAGFDDIAALGADCRFRDCTHGDEPGCAVQAAIADGALDRGRLESLHKLSQELARQRQLALDGGNAKRRWRGISLAIRRFKKDE